MSVAPRARHVRSSPCRVCGGYDSAALRGHGVRCYGFDSDDGKWIYCTREGHAGSLKLQENANAFCHKAEGDCRCGMEHAPAPIVPPAGPSTYRNRKQRYNEPEGTIDHYYVYYDEDGKPLHRVVRYRNPKDFRPERYVQGRGWYRGMKDSKPVLYRLPQLLAADKSVPVFMCYSHDTEVLTSHGWVAFPDLLESDRVAQYAQDTGAIEFTQPKAHQRFRYTGEMVRLNNSFSDLLVTPDHRMLVQYGRCSSKVVTAKELKPAMRLPVAGAFRSPAPTGPNIPQARFLAAYQADGRWEPRGNWITFNLKKDRKKERLRLLLTDLNVEWQERVFQSTLGWTTFIVQKDAVPWVTSYLPEKHYHPGALQWSYEARSAVLDEVAEWDGDRASNGVHRFFTAVKENADVISALAAVTCLGATVRTDERPSRPEQGPQFVVNFNANVRRGIGNLPSREAYDGVVYCCTVPSGFLVVRRNGKVTIAGNCEGEKDADRLASLGLVATCTMHAHTWEPYYVDWLKDRNVFICEDNDKDGQRQAERIYQKLLPHVRYVRRLTFPVPEGGDVSDWLDLGGSIDKLLEAASAPALDADRVA